MFMDFREARVIELIMGMTRTLRVLLTGFERFGPYSKNLTEEIVRGYDVKRLGLPSDTRVRLTALILPVHVEAFEALEKRTRGRRFDIVLHLGLHSRARCIQIETRAANRMDFRTPDNRGYLVKGAKVLPNGPRYLRSNLPLKEIVKELGARKVRFKVSDNAGGFVCNLLFYRSLHKKRRKGTLVGFIHIPQPRFYSKNRSVEALDSILRTCILHFV